MIAVSLNQLMIDVLGRGDPRENVTQTNIVEIDRYGVGPSWCGPIYPVMVIQNCMRFLEVV